MANKTINDLTVTTSAAVGDLIPIWRASNADTRKITKANFIGAILTGAGTIATGGFTLTVGANSTVTGSLVGNMTGAGTVATGGFTLTVPATGTAALRGSANTFTALQTFSNGIAFANETLSTYDEGTFTPVVADAAAAGNTATGDFSGWYTKIGHRVWIDIRVENINKTGLTAGATLHVRGFPFTVQTATGYEAIAIVKVNYITYTGYVVARAAGATSYVVFQETVTDNTVNLLTVADVFSSGFTDMWLSISYITA